MLPKVYSERLTALKDKIRHARAVAIFTVNSQLLNVYWEIGQTIAELEKLEGWGAKTIDRMAMDLKLEFPDIKGLAARSLRYMRVFYAAYPNLIILRQPAAESPLSNTLKDSTQKDSSILRQVAAKLEESPLQAVLHIPWAHHQVILDKVKEYDERLFYVQKTVENGWGRTVLAFQIESDLYSRQGKAINNFSNTLPPPQSDLASETFKNPYMLEFLGLEEGIKEKDLEKALTFHLKDFLLELGRGFTYAGNQFHINVDGNDYYLDLLFFNYNLNCFVIFELKIGEFQPEFAGKLNFYINTVDFKIKADYHNRTIGVLLCKTPNKTVVKFTLDGIEKPIAVSDYQLAKALPQEIINEMPTIEELDQELNQEIDKLKTGTEKRFDSLKEKLASINKEKVETAATFDLLTALFQSSFKPMYESLIVRLNMFKEHFISANFYWFTGDGTIRSLQELSTLFDSEENLKKVFDINLLFSLNGLKSAGVDTFNTSIQLRLNLDEYRYNLSLINYNNQQPFKKKLYTQSLSNEDIQEISDIVCDQIIENINRNIKN